jgi:indole-3-glycerol phosphate synthase
MKTDPAALKNRGPLSAALIGARAEARSALMADIKFRSARDQQLIDSRRIEEYVQSLVAGGVDGLSVVTEPRHFGGSLDLAARVRSATRLPLIRKEFFSRVEQIDESAAAGFDAVQLTISVIRNLELIERMSARAAALGLEFIICIQDQAELDQALELGATIIGINNRDILALETDNGTVSRTESLMPSVPSEVLVISESSMLSAQDIQRAVSAGIDGVLIGTAFAKAADPTGMVREFRRVLRR